MKQKLPRNKKSRIKTAKGRKISSTRWLERQLRDPYIHAAKSEGYRSRAAYKLLEINEKFNFIKPNLIYIDIGAAPGSWSQVLVQKAKNPEIIAIDLTEIKSLGGIKFIQGDFTDPETQKKIESLLNDKADVILSDMATPSCGHATTDHLRIISLAEEVLEFSLNNLKKNGKLLIKILKGSEENKYFAMLKQHFINVKFIKPKASREDSREVYIYAESLKNY